jgi:hypothetical protein
MEGFKSIPLDALSRIHFANPNLKAHDFLDENGEWLPFICPISQDYGEDEALLAEFAGNQFQIMNALKDIVRKEDSEWLGDFLCFCTGSSFLPDVSIHSKYKLTIEFNLVETHPEMLPVAHTCVHTLKLPFQAYNGDEEKFEHKLRQSVEYSKGRFTAR